MNYVNFNVTHICFKTYKEICDYEYNNEKPLYINTHEIP